MDKEEIQEMLDNLRAENPKGELLDKYLLYVDEMANTDPDTVTDNEFKKEKD